MRLVFTVLLFFLFAVNIWAEKPAVVKTNKVKKSLKNASQPVIADETAEKPAVVKTNKVQKPLKNAGQPVIADETEDSLLVTVNGKPITLYDVVMMTARQEMISIYTAEDKVLKEHVQSIRQKTVELLIERQLVLSDFEMDPFPVEEQYIQDELGRLGKLLDAFGREDLEVALRDRKQSMNSLYKRAKDNVIFQMMLSKYYFNSVNVTPREVYQYYQDHKKEYIFPAEFRIEVLFIKGDDKDAREKVKKIAEDLKSENREIFYSLVRIYSDGPKKDSGGDLGWIKKSEIRKEFADAVMDLHAGAICKPFKLDNGTYFIRLADEKIGGSKKYADVSREISDKLTSLRRKDIYNRKVAELKRKAVIRYFF